MTDAASAADQLLTEATSAEPPAKVEGKAIDPAAHIDPTAANLNPAKVVPPKAKKPRTARKPSPAVRARKRATAKAAATAKRAAAVKASKATAGHAAAARDTGKAEYDAAVAHEVESFAKMPEDALLELRLADGGEFIEGFIVVGPDLAAGGQGMTFKRDIDIGPEGPPVRVDEVWLIATSGDAAGTAVRCAVGPLSGGNGHHARIPAGHLKF